jgi:hypothetical protein
VISFGSDSKLEQIDELAFSHSGLKTIIIPSHIRVIAGSAFAACLLEFVSMSSEESDFRVFGELLEDASGSSLIRYFGGLESVVLSGSFTVLGKSCFLECASVSFVAFELNSKLTRIEEEAFCASSLAAITIPSSVQVLGPSCFSLCKSLISVTFEPGSKLERVDEGAFAKSGIQTIDIPSSVAHLCKSCFFGCGSLGSVSFELGSRLRRIEESTFSDAALQTIAIPSSIEVLCRASFLGCRSLASISFESHSRLERIDEEGFYYSGLKKFVVPSSVETLGRSCFSQCKSLESVTFERGARLQRIDEDAFSLCPRLQRIEFPVGAEQINPSVRAENAMRRSPLDLVLLPSSPRSSRCARTHSFAANDFADVFHRGSTINSPGRTLAKSESNANGRQPFPLIKPQMMPRPSYTTQHASRNWH